MRILFLSSFYPPFHIGGWEQWAKVLADRLQERGHPVEILTSNFRRPGIAPVDPGVSRCLRLENDQLRYNPFRFFTRYSLDRADNFRELNRVCQVFQPQAVMVHSMWNLNRSILWKLEQLLPERTVYYMSDYWPAEPGINQAFWENQGKRSSRLGWRSFLSRLALNQIYQDHEKYRPNFKRVIYVSQAVQKSLQNSGLKWAARGCVIHNGVDIKMFSPKNRGEAPGYLLFVGSPAPHKGLSTVMEALAILNETPGLEDLTVQVAGASHPAHLLKIEAQVKELNLAKRVKILGRVNREQLPELYRGARALVFPSVWDEPLALTTQEAMACGTPVIATLTGGTAELIVDGINGLAFAPGNAGELASQIKRLWFDPNLAQAVGRAGRHTIETKFDIELTTTQFEHYLSKIN